MKKFILLHRAKDNTPIIINTDCIIAIYKDTMPSGAEKTLLTCDDEEIDGIYVNESVERVYNIMYDIKNTAEQNNISKNE